MSAPLLSKRREAAQLLALRGGRTVQLVGIESSVLFETCLGYANAISGLLLLAGIVLALVNSIVHLLNQLTGTQLRMVGAAGSEGAVKLSSIRLQLGGIIMLALELLVAADVMDTIVKPVEKIEDLYKLALVAGIRTALSYFLAHELKEVEEEEHTHRRRPT